MLISKSACCSCYCSPTDSSDCFSVDGYMQPKAFISTQGPLPATIPDFWRMIWSEKTVVIVMTTRTVERCRQKCGQYWPLDEGTEEEYGCIKVRNDGTEVSSDYVVSKLLVTDTKVSVDLCLPHPYT